MAAENYLEGLRVLVNAVTNPQALRQLERLPGEVTEGLRNTLRTFHGQAVQGIYGPEIRRKVLFPEAPAPRPIPSKAEKATQLPLALKTQSGRPVTATTPRPTARNVETIRAGMRERAVDMPTIRLPGEIKGQMSVFAAPEPQFKYSIHTAPRPEWGPEALPLSLRQADSETTALLKTLEPGTASSLAKLADDIAAEYNVPAGEALKNITGPRGTDYLAYLNTSRKLAASPTTAVVQPGGGGAGIVPTAMGSVSGSRGGALTVAPSSALDDSARRAAEGIVEADIRVLPNIPGILGAGRGAVGSATTDLGRAVRGLGLTPAQLKVLAAGGFAAGTGLGLGLLGRDDRTPSTQQLTEEQLYPPQRSGAASPSSAGRTTGGTQRPSVVGQTGSGQVVITQNDQESAYRQAAANAVAAARASTAAAPGTPMGAPAMDPTKPIADYYRARQEYVRQPGIAQTLAREVSALPGAAPQAPIWAAHNPGLAYELLQRSKARPDLSQQTPQPETVSVGTQLGDNNVNNAAANAAYGASAQVDRSAGAADLEDATRPLIRPKLNYVPLGGRFVSPTGPLETLVPFG